MKYLSDYKIVVCFVFSIFLLSVVATSCSDCPESSLIQSPIKERSLHVTSLNVGGKPLIAGSANSFISPFVSQKSNSIHIPIGSVDYINDTTTLVNRLGTNGFQNPDTIIAEFSTFFIAQPTIVMAKEGYVRDKNSLSLSSFSKLQGLIDNVINVIYNDRNGNMWLGTDGGVIKYDGKWFTSYTTRQGLHSNEVISIIEDRKGNLWFGHYVGGGVSVFNGESFSYFSNVPALVDDYVWSIFEDSHGCIWFGTTSSGVFKFDGKTVVRYGRNQGFADSVFDIAEDVNHCIWFVTGSRVCRFNGESFVFLFNKTGLCPNKYVNSLLLDKSGNIWFGSSKGVYRYDGTSLLRYSKQSGLSDDVVSAIYQDSKGNLWFGTDVGGVSKFDGEYFSHITMKDGLTNNTVFSIAEDNGGNMWFGTWTGGLCKYSGDLFTHLTTNEGLPENNILALLEDQDGSIWMGTWDNGLCKYRDGFFYSQDNFKRKVSENPIFSMMQDQSKSIWIGYELGISRLKDGKMEMFFDRDPEKLIGVKAIYEDQLGNVWFSSSNRGLVKWVKSDNVFFSYSVEQGLPSNNICSIYQDSKGLLWIGTTDKGFGFLEGESLSWFSNVLDNDVPMIYAITEDRLGNIWLGSRGEALFVWCSQSISQALESTTFFQNLYKINNRLLLNLTSKQGLQGDFVNAMITTKEGDIVIGTDFGLSKVSATHLASDEAFVKIVTSRDGLLFENYGHSDGFLGMGVNYWNNGRNIVERKSGEFWIAANNMVTCFNPKARKVNVAVPVMQIVDIELSGEHVDWFKLSKLKKVDKLGRTKFVANDSIIQLSNGVIVKKCQFDSLSLWNSLPSNLSLHYKNNYITFNYVGSSISDSYKLKYQYILEGFDTQWSYSTNNTSVAYANLLPKNYTFRVKGMNSQGIWSEPVSFSFTIRPPWWQTRWFYTLSVLTVLLLLYLAYRLRTASLHANQRKLKMEIDIATLEISNSNIILNQQYDDLCEKSAIVSEQKEELEAQRDAISSQKSELERVYSELNESIDYAMQIQSSVLPEFTEVKEHCNDYFIFYRPRDFVSGDFYWSAFIEGRLILAVADCTGHGVPGGFMSMLGMTYLKQIVTKEYITQSDVILKKLRREIITTLRQKGSIGEHKDGMDISLCSIDVKTLEMQWSGAYNPCIIIRDDELIEIKGDKMPVAIYDRMDKFTLHHFQLQKGDVIYLYTDGYADQFGGPKEKRFNSKNVKSLLLEISQKPMNIQRQELEDRLSAWMHSDNKLNEQLDDITIVGVRI